MKKVLIAALSAGIISVASAQSFSGSNLVSSLTTATSTETAVGPTIQRMVQNFVLSPGDAHTIAWVFNFNSNPLPSYDQVRLIVRGRLEGGSAQVPSSVQIIGSEEIFSTAGGPAVQVGMGVLNASASTVASDTFVASTTIAINPPTSIGTATKDILFINTGGGRVIVDSISQEFQPVPEPASIAALSLGLLAVLRRKSAK